MKEMKGIMKLKSGKPVPGFLLVLNSDNAKTGKMPVTTSPMFTCPLACPYKEHGCYAAYGPIRMWWKACTESCMNIEKEWDKFTQRIIHEIPTGTIWRHNQAGDFLPSSYIPRNRFKSTNRINVKHAVHLALINRGKRGYTYTHYPVIEQKGVSKHDVLKNRDIIEGMNRVGFTVNISCNSLAHADEVIDSKLKAPISVTIPENFKNEKVSLTPKGRKVILCPAIWKKGMTCLKCQACMNPKRKAIIGFSAHGTGRKHCERVFEEWKNGAPK